MPDTVVLLRAVNVGGRGVLPMATLRAIAEGCGHGAVRTYIQSGTLLFDRRIDDLAAVAAELQRAIRSEAGVETTVVLRTREQLRAVAAEHPFAAAATEPKHLAVAFLAAEPDPERAATFDPASSGPERALLSGRDLYLHYPEGMARTKLDQKAIDRRLGVPGTTRNWRTVQALKELAV